MLGNRQLSDIPGNLQEVIYSNALKIRDFFMDFFGTEAALVIILLLIGYVGYYLLQYIIGLKKGREDSIKENEKIKNLS
jgi:hypothetical protein